MVVRRGRTVLVGPLMGIPTASTTKPLLVVQVGDYPVALHPTAVIRTIPHGGKATITVTPQSMPAVHEHGRAAAGSQPGGGAIGDAINGKRSMKLLPGRWRNRRKCYCGCGAKQSHGGYADGIAMTSGCEWAMRYWVNHGQLPTLKPGDTSGIGE